MIWRRKEEKKNYIYIYIRMGRRGNGELGKGERKSAECNAE